MSLKLQIYYLENYLNNFIIKNLNHVSAVNLIITFLGGTLNSLNPCTISIYPLYFSYIQNFKLLKKQTNYWSNTFILLAGIFTSTAMFGLISLYTGKRYGSILSITPFLSSIITITIGLSLMNVISVNYSEVIQLQKHSYKNINTYLTGVIIGLTTTPCSTPILITLLLWINYTEDFFTGLIFLIIYTIGYMVPLTTITYSTINFTAFSLIKNYWFTFTNTIGAILLGIGTFYLLHIVYFLLKT